MPRGGKRPDAGRKPSGNRRVKTSLTLPADKLAKLDALAAEAGKTRSELMESLIDSWEKLKLFENVLDKFKTNG